MLTSHLFSVYSRHSSHNGLNLVRITPPFLTPFYSIAWLAGEGKK
nr:uncharacterized protein CTRU02_01907 [Colletotrichum truncatum]KAF6799036.1 hypothetical protein CTRU02_01907 [Colletotrichum truncatum]